MAWVSHPYRARFDIHTPLDAAAIPAAERFLRGLAGPLAEVHEWTTRSARRLARGQVRVEVHIRLRAENRLVVRKADLLATLTSLEGSVRFLPVGGRLVPLLRLHRIRLLRR